MSRRYLPSLFVGSLAAALWQQVACDSGGGAVRGEPDAAAADARVSGDTDANIDASPTSDAGLDAAADASKPLDATSDGALVPEAAVAEDAAVDAAPFVCAVRAPTSCPEPAPRYADVEPVFAERCVICHAGNWNGPWPLNSYQHVADWEDTIRSNVLDCTMPPLDAGVPITTEERTLILTWLRCGMPR